TDHRVEDRDYRHLYAAAAFLKHLAKRLTYQGKENDTRVCRDPGDDPLDLAARAHHAPDVFDGLGLVELHETSPGHRIHGLSGRVRHEMEMKPAQPWRSRDHRVIPAALCT